MNEKEFVGQCFLNKLHVIPGNQTSTANVVNDIAYIITAPGIINITKEDLQQVADSSKQVYGVSAEAKGKDRAETVGKELVSLFLRTTNHKSAKNVIFNVIGSPDITLYEVNEIADHIFDATKPGADIIFSAAIDESKKDFIKTTVIFGGN